MSLQKNEKLQQVIEQRCEKKMGTLMFYFILGKSETFFSFPETEIRTDNSLLSKYSKSILSHSKLEGKNEAQ